MVEEENMTKLSNRKVVFAVPRARVPLKADLLGYTPLIVRHFKRQSYQKTLTNMQFDSQHVQGFKGLVATFTTLRFYDTTVRISATR